MLAKGNHFLFNVSMYNYVNELSECLTKSGVGGKMNGTVIIHMFYADDYVLFLYLQQLLNIRKDYYDRHDLIFNTKSHCICILAST